jgi:hypothetical protein
MDDYEPFPPAMSIREGESDVRKIRNIYFRRKAEDNIGAFASTSDTRVISHTHQQYS